MTFSLIGATHSAWVVLVILGLGRAGGRDPLNLKLWKWNFKGVLYDCLQLYVPFIKVIIDWTSKSCGHVRISEEALM